MEQIEVLQKRFEDELLDNPDNLDARANLAHALQLQDQYQDAEFHFESVLAQNPLHIQALENYCQLLQHGTDGLMRIEALCRRALETDDSLLNAKIWLAKAMLIGLKTQEGLAILESALRPPFRNGIIERELLLTYSFYLGYSDTITPMRMTQSLSGLQKWLNRHFPQPMAIAELPVSLSKTLVPLKKLPIKLGIICAHAYHHPVGRMLISFVDQFDPERITLIFYNASRKQDDVTAFLRNNTKYVDVSELNDMDLAEKIRQDNIEVLIDTDNVTHPTILSALANRCAPVQLSWGGWVYSHPLSTIDGFIADEITVDEKIKEQFLQTVYCLPKCVYTYRPFRPLPAPSSLPAEINGFITFGSFNNLAKVNNATLDLWAAVLKAIPSSYFVIKAATIADQETRTRLVSALQQRGIQQDRLALGLPSLYEEFLEDFSRIDIMLDCVPFNGGMTTIDSLWQGVPLLALQGISHASRVGMSLMTAAGLPQWIAHSADNYVELAKQLSSDIPALAKLRAELPDKLMHSALSDTKGFAEAITNLCESLMARGEDSQ